MSSVCYNPKVPLVGQSLPLLMTAVRLAQDVPSIIVLLEVAVLAALGEHVHVLEGSHRNLNRG